VASSKRGQVSLEPFTRRRVEDGVAQELFLADLSVAKTKSFRDVLR
jgi:hypothetical protein